MHVTDAPNASVVSSVTQNDHNILHVLNAPDALASDALDSSFVLDFNDLNYLRSVKTDSSTLNTRLKKYMGCSVVNLSNLKISPHCLQTLNYGLSFCPTPTEADNTAITEATESFFRKLKLKIHFHQRVVAEANASAYFSSTSTHSVSSATPDCVPPEAVKRLNIRSSWTPDVHDTNLTLFMTTVRRAVHHLSDAKKKHIPSNLDATQRRMIEDLKNNKNITIKKADKGNSIVILNTVDYLFEAITQLSNRTFYAPQASDLTISHEILVNQLVTSWYTARLIDIKVKNFLWASRSKTARFYLLAKIHKKGIPGRPIVSAIGSPTEHLSAFVDALLCPLVDSNASYIRDTTDFINKISTINVNEGSIIFTCDVTSLYTRINHPLGLRCIAKKLRDTHDFAFPKHRVLQALKLVLTCNNFEFNGKHYLQTSGVSMGTKCAPTYANLVLGVLENEFLDSYPLKPTCWFRFIDDIFGIWDHSLPELETFVSGFNQLDPSIQITLEHSTTEVAFLDTRVIKSNDRLITDLYRKPTDTTNYLMQKSAHPPGCKKGAYSQYLRLRRNCTTIVDYDTHAEKLTTAYLTRGYDRSELTGFHQKVKKIPRKDLLQVKKKEQSSDNLLVCTLPYNKLNVDARKIITDYWHILSEATHLDGLFKDLPTFGYTRPKNLKNHLCQAIVNYPPKIDAQCTITDTYTCTRTNCSWCMKINAGKRFKSSITQERHKKLNIPVNVSCETFHLIYLITCPDCHKQYVGETKRAFRTRLSEHDRDVRYNKDTVVARHFNENKHNWNGCKLDIIEHFIGDMESQNSLRLKRETYWIAHLRSLMPLGLNVMIGRQFTQ
jgi:hypothetical protein